MADNTDFRLSRSLEIDMVCQGPLPDRRERKRPPAPVEQCPKKKPHLNRRDLDAVKFLDGLRIRPVVDALNAAIASKDETIAALKAALAAKDEALRILMSFK